MSALHLGFHARHRLASLWGGEYAADEFEEMDEALGQTAEKMALLVVGALVTALSTRFVGT